MGFTNKLTRIMDIQLTDRGRDLLSRNQLEIVYYAFSDEMIDYSGSLNQSLQTGQRLDDVVYKNFLGMEANQMSAKGMDPDLSSFLYTAPEQRDVLPQLTIPLTSSFILTRLFEEKSLVDFINEDGNSGEDSDFVIITSSDEVSPDDREKQFAAEQNLQRIDSENPLKLTLGIK